MPYLLPTNLPVESHLLADPAEIKNQIPTDGSGLPSLGQYQFHLSFDEAASLGYAVARLDQQYQHEVLVFQSARFLDIDYKGATYRYGAAVEAIITVSVIKADGSATVAAVAASVQLSHSNATSSLLVRGYLPQKPMNLPEWGEFDVGAYSKFEDTVTELQSVLFDNANIRPQLLATTMPPGGSDYAPVAGQAYALEAISRGQTAQEALGRLSSPDPDVSAAVEKIYQAASLGDDQRPDAATQARAKDDLSKVHVPITRHWGFFSRRDQPS